MSADDRELAAWIRTALPPLGAPSPEVDLWPQLERRLASRRTRLTRLDWLLATLALALLAGIPEVLLVVLYHL